MKYFFKFCDKKRMVATSIMLIMCSATSSIQSIILLNVISAIQESNMSKLFILSFIAIAWGIGTFRLAYFSNLLIDKHIMEFNVKLKNQLMDSIIYKNKVSNNPSEELANFSSNITSVENGYIRLVFYVGCWISEAIISFITGMFINPILAILLFSSGIIPVIIPHIAQKKNQKLASDSVDQNSNYLKSVKEYLSFTKTMKLFSVEDKISKKHARQNEATEKSSYDSDIFAEKIKSWSDIFQTINSNVIGIVVPGFFVIAGFMTLPMIFAMMPIQNGVVTRLMWVIRGIPEIQKSITAIDKLNLFNADHKKKETYKNTVEDIKLNDFSVIRSDKELFEKINLEIKKNSRTLIVGKTGIGKSSLFDVLLGFCNTFSGEVLIDNEKIKDDVIYPFGLIQQTPAILDEDIIDNITLFEDYPKEDVVKVIEQVGLNEVFELHGEDWKVGEEGSKLSGGQKQRIEIARVLLRSRQVLLLDEITSALDKETAGEIKDFIFSLENVTIVEIAHHVDENQYELYDNVVVLQPSS